MRRAFCGFTVILLCGACGADPVNFSRVQSVSDSKSMAQEATLQCWKTNFTDVAKPFMTAKILSDKKLKNVQFLYRNSEEENSPGVLIGELITSNHSPYKGNNQYTLANKDTLILPADLSKRNLEDVFEGGIGYQKGENGVIIGFARGDDTPETGNHYSYRLKCSSDK